MLKRALSVGIISGVIVFGAVGVSDCTPASSPTWWQNFLQDPVEQVQSFDEGVSVILQGVAVAWSFVQPLIPAAQLPQVTQAYENAIASVTNAEQILLDSAQTIAAAQGAGDAGTMATITALMQDVYNAIESVLAIVDQWKSSTVGDGGVAVSAVPGLAAAHAEQKTLQFRFLGDAGTKTAH